MKNIEKYPNTKDAMKAYNALDSKTVSFEAWLVCEYKEPHAPTLLKAANAATKAWFLHFPGDTLAPVTEAICNLASTIKRKKHNPVRNFGKYKTAEEAVAQGFGKGVTMKKCDTCCWHGHCAIEFYNGGCNGRNWKPSDGSVRREEECTQEAIDKIVSDCSDFCHFADELHKLVVESHKVDDLTGTKEKCLVYAAQLWFQNKGKLTDGGK